MWRSYAQAGIAIVSWHLFRGREGGCDPERPYDLRHAAVSLWLNAGVPAPTVARRAGHSVEVLLRVYANCIDGDDEIANERISSTLG